jgi:hypothetical protein
VTDFLSQTSTSNGASPIRGAVSQRLVDKIIEGVAGSGPAVVSTAQGCLLPNMAAQHLTR